MFSYLVALLAIGLFLANPIGHYLFPPQGRSPSRHLAPKPRMNESLLALVGPEDAALDCPVDAYATRIISREPLVLYLEGFRSSEPLFEASTVTHKVDDVHRDTAVRNSSVALIPRTATVRCIEARARALQGWRDDVFLERLRTQRYVAGGHYAHHFDYGAAVGGWGRVSSFMVWLDTQDLQGGGTEFPYLAVRGEAAKPWCRLVECDTTAARPQPTGTVFKPLAGNAVYWENFAADGRGSDATWHAGLPVMEGVKVGLNIWSTGRIL
ncbi:Prolyl 4-hydroxylase subunit alpha-1 [Drechmeria coniospora]|uniref:Prolyl 4-hydroxylase subunit alpha-1 n=1 Tax=Drechmeria coniospora TaxID=98403 RepID=A0A151GHB8_DRECN|nr:Prolyl 4-hydroxylase subunit alpha-1 [Drechmeria coniospora]KYK56459.1 Prolyl 4-hydroxylase subunit alpha-1 [Drechmeria coniospora]